MRESLVTNNKWTFVVEIVLYNIAAVLFTHLRGAAMLLYHDKWEYFRIYVHIILKRIALL
jgi:hypothetical protein